MKVKTARRWLARNVWKIAKYKSVEYAPKWFRRRYEDCLFTLTRPIRMRRF